MQKVYEYVTIVRLKSVSVYAKKYNPALKVVISARNLSFSKDNILYLPIYMVDKLPEILRKIGFI